MGDGKARPIIGLLADAQANILGLRSVPTRFAGPALVFAAGDAALGPVDRACFVLAVPIFALPWPETVGSPEQAVTKAAQCG